MRAWRHVDQLVAFGEWSSVDGSLSSPKSVMHAPTRWATWGRDVPLPWILRVLLGLAWGASVVVVGRMLEAVGTRLVGAAASS
jgi:hypothetical protein